MDIVKFLGVLAVYGQRIFVYPGSVPGICHETVESPDRFQLPYEHLNLVTTDNIKLKAFLLTQKLNLENSSEIRTSAKTDVEFASRRPCVFVFHGNAENYGDGIIFARLLYLRLRTNVVLASYRGYGGCDGVPSEAGIRIDAQTVFDYILKHPVLGSCPKIVYGLSIGGGVAIDLASRNPDTVDGLIVENTFLSLPKMLPVMMPSLAKFKFLVKDKWRSEVAIKNVPPTTPILFLSGALDEVIPPSHMQQLCELSSSEPGARRTFVSFEKGGHNNTWQQPDYRRSIRRFLDQTLVEYRKTH